jgi:hypothetical protein
MIPKMVDRLLPKTMANESPKAQLSGGKAAFVYQQAKDNAFHLSPRANYAPRDPDERNDRNRPGREKRERHTDHAQTPCNSTGALRKCTPQRGKQAAVLRNDIALAVDLD